MWPPYIITYKTVMLNHKNIRKNSPADIYLFKVHIRNFSKRCVICSKLTIKTAGRRQWRWRCSGVLIVNFEHISQLFQLFFGVFNLRMITNHRLISSFFKRNIYRFFHLCLRIYNDINSWNILISVKSIQHDNSLTDASKKNSLNIENLITIKNSCFFLTFPVLKRVQIC